MWFLLSVQYSIVFDAEKYRHHYNSLPQVEVANANLNSRENFYDFLNEAEKLVTNYGFEKYVGFRLIHKHFELPQFHVMVEELQDIEGIPSLVSQPIEITIASLKGAVPSGWLFSSTSRNIFEFSTDSAVQAGLNTVQSAPKFLDDIEKLLNKYQIEDIMSVSLLRKESLVPQEGQHYLETTFPTASIVQIVNDSESSDGIRTSWTFGKEPRMQRCWAACRWDNSVKQHRKMYHN